MPKALTITTEHSLRKRIEDKNALTSQLKLQAESDIEECNYLSWSDGTLKKLEKWNTY